MPPYEIGQEIRIKQFAEPGLSLRESDLRPYAGSTGTISNYYWISPPTGGVFYLYTVRVDRSNKEIVLYEDEMSSIPKKAGSQ